MPKDVAHWTTYNSAQVGRAPRRLCLDVLELAGPGGGRVAVEIGAGAGVEAKAMLDAGWVVHAYDRDPEMPERLRALAGADADVVASVGQVEQIELPPADLVHSGYSLPYLDPARFDDLWLRIRAALRPGGWLAVNLFGDRDEWAGDPTLSIVTRERLDEMFDGLEVVRLDEEDADGMAFSGPKHWHVFTVIARRPG